MFRVRQSSVRGCRFSFVFVYFIIKYLKCSLVPASFFPYISTSLQNKTQAWSSLVFQCRHSSFYSFRSSSVGLETGEWRRCRSLSFTPPASLRSHGSRPRPTRHTHPFFFIPLIDLNASTSFLFSFLSSIADLNFLTADSFLFSKKVNYTCQL